MPKAYRTAFTSGEAAKVLRVGSGSSLKKMYGDGSLKGFTIPGGDAVRFPKSELIRFGRDQYGVDFVPFGLTDDTKILIINLPTLTAAIRGPLESEGYTVVEGTSDFDVGCLIKDHHPGLIVLSGVSDYPKAVASARILRAGYAVEKPVMVAYILGTPRGSSAAGFDEHLRADLPPNEMAYRLDMYIQGKVPDANPRRVACV